MYNNRLNKKFGVRLIKTFAAAGDPVGGFTLHGAGCGAKKKRPGVPAVKKRPGVPAVNFCMSEFILPG